jgi:hypothetical protein
MNDALQQVATVLEEVARRFEVDLDAHDKPARSSSPIR